MECLKNTSSKLKLKPALNQSSSISGMNEDESTSSSHVLHIYLAVYNYSSLFLSQN